MIRSALALLLGCLFIAPNFFGYASNEEVSDNNIVTDACNSANWTVMFYLCCENHVSYEAEKLVQNLTKIGSSDDLHLIVLKDQDQNGDSRLYYVEKDNLVNLNPIYEWPDEVDMGDPNTLYLFVNLVKENYQAEHYALYLLSDMGSGWQGICHDARNPNKGIPLMSIPVFADVFKQLTDNGTDKFDVLVLNPCVCGMAEVAYEILPYINYIVFSEEHMLEELDKGPEYTLQYKACIWNLKNNTSLTPEEFANSFVDSYKSTDFPMWILYGYMVILKKGHYLPIIEKISNVLSNVFNSLPNPDFHLAVIKTTLSSIDLDKMDELTKAIDNLSSTLLLYLDDPDVNGAIREARKEVREYGKFYAKNRATALQYINIPIEKLAFDSFVDLYDLVYLINQSTSRQAVKDACQDVMKKLEDAVVRNSALPDDSSHGLSIYFPEDKDLYNRYLWSNELPFPYENLRFSKDTKWDEFLKEYLGI